MENIIYKYICLMVAIMKCATMCCTAFQNCIKDNIQRLVLHLPTGCTKLWLYSITRHNGKYNIHISYDSNYEMLTDVLLSVSKS
jgi:hypothetical protein